MQNAAGSKGRITPRQFVPAVLAFTSDFASKRRRRDFFTVQSSQVERFFNSFFRANFHDACRNARSLMVKKFYLFSFISFFFSLDLQSKCESVEFNPLYIVMQVLLQFLVTLHAATNLRSDLRIASYCLTIFFTFPSNIE